MSNKKTGQQLIDKETGEPIFPKVLAADLLNEDGTPYVLPAKIQPDIYDTSTNILLYENNKGVAIGSDNKHAYVWNGSNYVDIGPFISGGISDGEITTSKIANGNIIPIKTTFFNKSTYNLFDTSTATKGKWVYYETGVINNNENYILSDYISVVPFSIITFSSVITHFVGYTSDKQFVQITWEANGQSSLRLPANCAYIRVSFDVREVDPSTFVVTNGVLNGYKPAYEFNTEYLKEQSNNSNLFDKYNLIKGFYCYFLEGTTLVNDDWAITPNIDVVPGQTLYFSRDLTHFAFYDDSGDFIQAGVPSTGVTSFVVPSNAKTARFSVQIESVDSLVISYNGIETDVKEITIAADGSGDYTDIAQGFNYAFDNGNMTVYIEGVFDLISLYGSADQNLIDKVNQGFRLGKNNHYIFRPGSKIVCNYTGNSEWICSNLSIFFTTVNDGNFILEGANLECSNVRYCVHDECGGTLNVTPYKHEFYNCKMVHANTNPLATTTVALGGGLGNGASIVIRSCIFIDNTISSTHDVLYHANWDTSQIATDMYNIIVKDSYFLHTYRISSPVAQANTKSTIQIVGNSMATQFINDDTYNVEWEVYDWNNELRS